MTLPFIDVQISKDKFFIYAKMLRVNQWMKNLVVLTAVIFSGKLFVIDLLFKSLFAFIVFCLLSSASYILNDIIDYEFDKKHPIKRNRPIAAGLISIPEATSTVFLLTLSSLIVSLFFSLPFFFLSLVFILLHFFYSLYLKRFPVVDIFAISFSFMIRTFAGEVVSGFHIPIWLLLTIFFISLFMATIKRQAELMSQGRGGTRESLYLYSEHLLNFLTYSFSTLTILAYSFYTYLERPAQTNSPLSSSVSNLFPSFEARRWMMITIPLVVYGIARYAQIFYEKVEGERPEKIITTDRPLVATIFLWGVIVIGLIYIF